jgi:hypothetical protein
VTDQLEALLQAGAITAETFPESSRYRGIETAARALDDGRTVRYLRRRLVPSPDRFALLHEHEIVAGERVDDLAALYLDDPEQFWRLCDANGILRPADLTSAPGARIRITLPEGIPGPADD